MTLTVKDLKDQSYEELREAEKVLAKEMEKKRNAARAEAISTIIDLIMEFEITSDDVNKAADGRVKLTPKRKPTGKVAPKYRNPETGALWTGRGLAPLWIRDYSKEERDKFLISTEPPKEQTKADNAVSRAVPDTVSEGAEEVDTTAG